MPDQSLIAFWRIKRVMTRLGRKDKARLGTYLAKELAGYAAMGASLYLEEEQMEASALAERIAVREEGSYIGSRIYNDAGLVREVHFYKFRQDSSQKEDCHNFPM